MGITSVFNRNNDKAQTITLLWSGQYYIFITAPPTNMRHGRHLFLQWGIRDLRVSAALPTPWIQGKTGLSSNWYSFLGEKDGELIALVSQDTLVPQTNTGQGFRKGRHWIFLSLSSLVTSTQVPRKLVFLADWWQADLGGTLVILQLCVSYHGLNHTRHH